MSDGYLLDAGKVYVFRDAPRDRKEEVLALRTLFDGMSLTTAQSGDGDLMDVYVQTAPNSQVMVMPEDEAILGQPFVFGGKLPRHQNVSESNAGFWGLVVGLPLAAYLLLKSRK